MGTDKQVNVPCSAEAQESQNSREYRTAQKHIGPQEKEVVHRDTKEQTDVHTE